MNFPSIEDFFVAISKDTTSAELRVLFLSLGISEENLNDENLDIKGRRVWSNKAAGLQLDFKDVGFIQDIPYHDIDEGPWVLTNVIFWGQQEDVDSSYKGPKPYDLDYSMDRNTVRGIMLNNNLGAPKILGVSGNVDMWNVGSKEIKVNYSGSKGIRSISIGILIERNKK